MNERLHVVGSSKADAAHRECWDLLPWLINGNLTDAQSARVEAHVAECAACTDELRQQRALRDRLREQSRTSDAILLAPQAGWQKMADRLAVEQGELAAQRPMRTRRTFAGTAAAACVAIAALSAVLIWQARDRAAERAEPRYSTLTADTPKAGANMQLRIVFARDVAVGDTATLLREIPAQIVAGPSEAGVYTVSLQVETRLPELLARLRDDARVVFVEPVVRIERAQ